MLEALHLFWVFFRIGLFTIGGGLAALPLLQVEALSFGWVTEAQFADIIAISESTPGPIGINMATYVGFTQMGVAGSIIATLGLVAPSIIIISIIARFYVHVNESKIVKGVFTGLRPAVLGLIATAAYGVARIALVDIDAFILSQDLKDLFNIKAIILFFVFLYVTNRWDHHPVYYVVIAGIIGMFLF